MTKLIELAPGRAMEYTVPCGMGMEQVREDDMDLIRKHFDLMDKLHHADEADTDELAQRIRGARRYIRRSCRRTRTGERKRTVFVQRMLAGSLLLLGWAVVMALLVG